MKFSNVQLDKAVTVAGNMRASWQTKDGVEMWREGDTLFLRSGTDTRAVPWVRVVQATPIAEEKTKRGPKEAAA